MGEPMVAATDFLLAAECVAFALLLAREPAHRAGRPLRLFFLAAGASALLGGIVHGFLEPGSALRIAAWRATMLSIGVAAAAACTAAGALHGARALRPALVALAFYAALVLSGRDRFLLAILFYLPAVFLLSGALLALRSREGPRASRPAALALLGLGGMLVAAAAQASGLSLHPVYFDHNVIYHLIQAAALALFFAGCLGIMRAASQ